MKLTLSIPYFNQLNNTKGIIGLLRQMTSDGTEWMVIDNGSSEPVEDFFREFIRPKRFRYIRNRRNVGMIATYQQIFDEVETDLVAILHNDVYVYEKNWDKRVVKTFKEIDKLGSLGFFGSQGCGPRGERLQDREVPAAFSGLSNLVEAEAHGMRLVEPWRPAAILDGFAMVFSMEMIKKAGGMDKRYRYHHMYDRDLPLTALSLGYKNVVLNVPCHHHSSLTANSQAYQQWINREVGQEEADIFTHDENNKLLAEKWASALPLYIENDFSFRKGKVGGIEYKGAKILKSK